MRLRLALVGALAALLAGALSCTAEPPVRKPPARSGPERVLVVVNRRSPSSVEVGRYYMTKRGIPAAHLVEVELDVEDEIGDLEFRARLLAPVRDAIARLPFRIDFVVLTTGVPLRIGGRRGYSVDAHLAGMRLAIPPMVGLDTAWLMRYRNPYHGAREPFDSDRFGIYLVTRLDCARIADCLALVDRSIAARPVSGPFFLDAMPIGGGGYGEMNRALHGAAFRMRLNGAGVLLDTSPRFVAPPMPVMGYVSWGSNDSHYDSTAYHAVRFLPGALAETFVSTSARTFGPVTGGQSLIADLVAQGVTGVKGYVSEPYALALADADILFDRYLRGFTLAEAFYAASRMILWKDVVIGDPLCAPYATLPATLGPRAR